MSAAGDAPTPLLDEESRSRSSKPGKERKRRRHSRSKQKETPESQFFEGDCRVDDGDNSNSSTPKYERPEELTCPAGGMICALCYCGEKSLLGQGDLTRYSASSGFNAFKKPPLRARGGRELLYGSSPGSSTSQDSFAASEKVTKTAAQRRGSKQMRETVKAFTKQQDYVDELSTVGCSEILDMAQVFEPSGHVTAHHCCAAWSEGVTQNDSYDLLCVDKAVHAGMSQRCHYCSRYGATIKCRAPKCERLFHYPCAAGSGCFQDIKSMSLLCTDHLELAPTIADPDELNCAVCDSPGQISDLLFCTSCGHHYHGDCLDPHVEVNPVVRAGWQCPECKICQTCRQPGDDNKMLVCDVCDKGYHTFCLRPAMTFIPKNGWCCKNCRRCTDCGSRTPGNGPSSRWHINYQVCDSCYQLRNKGHSCPICSRAYRNVPAVRVEMMQCSDCHKYVHWGCENPLQIEAHQKQPEDYKCPKCRDPVLAVPESSTRAAVVSGDGSLTPQQITEGQDFSLSVPPPESVIMQRGEDAKTPQEMMVLKSEPMIVGNEKQPPTVLPGVQASTTLSTGSDNGNIALKGSSLDPMLCLGEDGSVGDPHSLGAQDLASPPWKVRRISSDDVFSSRDRIVPHQSSADSNGNLGPLFSDENAQDAMSLFGVDTLPQSAPRALPPAIPSSLISPNAKTFQISQGFVSPTQTKVSLSPLESPPAYDSPRKPPGPGMGKPGAVFGKGKPAGHKRKPASAKSRGKGKGKGQKRGSFSGPRKRPRGGKGNVALQNIERNLPRRARRNFQRQVSASPSMGEESLISPTTKMEPVLQLAQADDEYGDSMHNTVVLCSTEDTFTLSQDMCVVCGSFGKGAEGRLIACSQCGQCYHPFCVNLKLTKVVLRKGWRCLDCTVCEECGQVDDPAHLLLCDDCDISYHTHCLKPPLQHVPKGGWKCKWCVRCTHCGTTSPGKNCEWAANYTACGPCASLNQCPKCRRNYKDEDIIMQCGTCERWIHSVCECLFTESDIEKVLQKGYECCFCRPKDAIPPHQMLVPQAGDPNFGSQAGVYMGRTRSEVEAVKEYHKDYTALTIAGLQHIQRQMQKHMGYYKKRPAAARGRNRKPSDNQARLHAPTALSSIGASVQPSIGQSINVAAAVTALQDPSEVYGKESNDGAPTVPLPLPVATGTVQDLASATATATEDSGMEGIERGIASTQREDLKFPIGDAASNLSNSKGLLMESSTPDLPKTVLGVQQGGIKRRRKPYRPGIGGFTLRQRGRGGLLKPRRRRTIQKIGQPPSKDTSEGSKTTDSLTTEMSSDLTVFSSPGRTQFGPTGLPNQTATAGDSTIGQQTSMAQGTPQFNPSTGKDPLTTVTSPVKLKIPASSSSKPRRKKKPKLIEQFPQYLQDAFFGKEILTAAEHKTTTFENMNEQPASPSSGYGPIRKNDSCLILPDRLLQRLEAQASHQATAALQSHGNATKSQRQQPQDEESMLMDRENEQELLGVLPDLPFKDDELLGMISSELKQEHGAGDSHDNILSPSSLEKMVRDGLDGLQNIDSDVAALFSDVLNQQGDSTVKQESHPRVQDASQQEKPVHVPHSLHQDAQAGVTNAQQSSLRMQQASGAGQQQLAIQQELQQLEMKQRQHQQQMQRQHVMQQQMNANVPPTGYPMTQQDQAIHVMNMGPARRVPGPGVTPHGMPVVGQHLDMSRPRSHHTTPVMSPAPTQQAHPRAQMHPVPGHSPHLTPPPAPMFARQASMPILSGMQSQSKQQELLGSQQSSSQIPQAMMSHQMAPTAGSHRLQGHIAGLGASVSTTPSITMPQGTAPVISTHAGLYPNPPASSLCQTPTFAPVNPPLAQTGVAHSQSQPCQFSRSSSVFQGSTDPKEMSVPPEAYIAANDPTTKPHSSSPKRPASVPVGPHSSIPSVSANQPRGLQPNPQPSTSEGDAPTSRAEVLPAVGSAVIQASENVLRPLNLSTFPSDTSIFEPSAPPWPLGMDVDGESPSVNQRNILKWEKDEPMGDLATISPVLFANVKYPELKKEFPDWNARAKQVAKLWRKATSEEKAPFLQKAKDNRALQKSSRVRRNGASKTPTPPIPSEEGNAKAADAASKLEANMAQLSTVGLQMQSTAAQPELSTGILTTVAQALSTTATAAATNEKQTLSDSASRTITSKPKSPTSASVVDAKQQPHNVPASAHATTQSSGQPTMGGSIVSQSPVKMVQAKTERRGSLEAGMDSATPYPQSNNPIQTPSLQESPTKALPAAGVIRSLSVGAALSGQHSKKVPVTPPADMKCRRLSMDSQVLQTPAADIKPQPSISPSSHVRQVIYQTSRRARLFDHSQPPPPYPSVSHGVTQATQRFIYPHLGPRGQVVQISGPRGVLSPGGTQAFIRTPSPDLHNSGMLALQFDGTTQHGMAAGHPMGQPPHPGFPAGVHRVQVKGQHPPGAYIELRHTNQNPESRRQMVLRMRNAAAIAVAAASSQAQPSSLPVQQPSSSGAVTLQVKMEPAQSGATGAKADDPFAGGHMPHDEHLDALLRSEEFKDLHFRGPQTTSAVQVPPTERATETSSAPSSTAASAVCASASSTQPASESLIATSQTGDEDKHSKDESLAVQKTTDAVSEASSSKEKDSDTVEAKSTKEGVEGSAPGGIGTDEIKKEVLATEHSYSKTKTVSASTDTNQSKKEQSQETDAASDVPGQKPKLGHAPPPTSGVECALAEVGPAKAGVPLDLTVGNAAAVSGSLPATQTAVKSPAGGQEGARLDGSAEIVGNVEKTSTGVSRAEKDEGSSPGEKKGEEKTVLSLVGSIEEANTGVEAAASSKSTFLEQFPPLPKSPVAPPTALKPLKFAEVPDAPSSLVSSEEVEKSKQGGERGKGVDDVTPVKEAARPAIMQVVNLEVEREKEVTDASKTYASTNAPDMEVGSMKTEESKMDAGENVKEKTTPDDSQQTKESGTAPVGQVTPEIFIQAATGTVFQAGKLPSLGHPESSKAAVPTSKIISANESKRLQTAVAPGTCLVAASDIDPKSLATVISTQREPQLSTSSSAAIGALGGGAREQEPTITVVHTSIATVTAYKQPMPPQTTAALNPPPSVTKAPFQPSHLGPQPQFMHSTTPQTTTTSAGAMDVPRTPTQPLLHQTQPMVPGHVASKEEPNVPVSQSRQKPLLINEQPLLLQELLEEEKREQEKARREKLRHTHTLMQQQVAVQQAGISPGVYAMPGVDVGKVSPDGRIDTIKMEFLSRMNQAAQVGLPVTDGTIAAQGVGAMHQQSQAWVGRMAGHQQAGTSTFGDKTELRKYRNWLIQQQQLMQIQVQKQEQIVQAKKTRKQSLMKKRNQYKRNGKQFSPEDAEELRVVTKQYTEAQQQLEKIRNDQKQHAELIQDFNLRQRHMGPMPAGGPTTMVQQRPQMATGMGTQAQQQQQQQIVIQRHPGASSTPQQPQQIMVPSFQSSGLHPGALTNPQQQQQQQIVMMQPGQQQVIIQNVPASNDTTGVSSTTASVAIEMQQQQPQVVMTTPQQQPALMTQFPAGGTRPSIQPQLQQIMISQHQLQHQQQQQLLQQQVMKVAHPRPPFMPPQLAPTIQTPVSSSPTSGNQAHNALIRMQMEQLMALQIEQQQLSAFQQNTTAKPKRRRRKKKSQAEKEEEERQALLAQQQQQQQQQQMQQVQIRAPGAATAGWQQRPTGPMAMQQQMMPSSQQMHHRFAVPLGSATLAQTVMPTPPPQPQNQHDMAQTSTPRPLNPIASSQLSGPLHPTLSGSAAPPTTTPTPVIQPLQPAQLPPRLPSAPVIQTSIQTAHMSAPLVRIPHPVGPQAHHILTSSSPTTTVQYSSLSSAVYSAVTHVQAPASAHQLVAAASVTPVNAVAGTKVISSLAMLTASQAPFSHSAAQMQEPVTSQCVQAMSSTPTTITVPSVPAPSTMPVGSATAPSTPVPQPSRTPTFSQPGRFTPRNQSPGYSQVSLEGLSEAEIAILMTHDPDLNEELTASAVAMPVSTPPLTVAATPDRDNKSPNDETKKKRPKKGHIMDQKTIDSIDNSIEKVIRLGAEYEEKLLAAKGQEGAPVTPSPWELEPKPTKFPPKKLPETLPMTAQDRMKAMLGQPQMQFTAQGIMQGVPADIMAFNQMQPGMGMMPFVGMKPPASVDGDKGRKKKRSRQGSKEVGADGKPVKRRRKKSDKNAATQQQQQQFQLGAMVDGGLQGMMMQAARPTLQGGKPGAMAHMVPFPSGVSTSGPLTVGQISPGQPGVADMSKVVSQWKPLPLLRLVEPDLRKSHHMCVPKGTGVTESRNFAKGLLGESIYYGVPDYYEVTMGLTKKLRELLSPPTSPSSKSLSPALTSSMASQSAIANLPHTATSAQTQPSGKYGPLGLASTERVTQLPGSVRPHPSSIKVPESLPTPPHQGMEDKDDLTSAVRLANDVLVPPSSPEMEDEDDWALHSLASFMNDDIPLILKTSPEFKPEKIRDLPSPSVPIMNCQKIQVPINGERGFLNDKDAVSVTIEFDNANIESIEKKLILLARILEAPIISYTMMETLKPDKKLKEALNQTIIKEEQSAPLALQTSQPDQVAKTQPEDTTSSPPRACILCKAVVKGNGVRRPQFNSSDYEEDVLYCNKDCYLKSELFDKKVTSTKKKFKASHVYQRQTQKISMAALLEKYPEEELIVPSKNTRSSVESIHIPSGVQGPLRGGPPGGRGRGRRRGPGEEPKVSTKKWKGVKWKKWSASVAIIKSSTKPPVDVESLLVKYGSALKAPADAADNRACVFCKARGDGDTHTIARLLNVDVDRWVHLNCALWSAEVYETQGGALINVDLALRRSESVLCCLCQKKGATIHCHRPRCVNTYHCQCALDIKCAFFKDKTVLCPTHAPKPGVMTSGMGFGAGVRQQHHSGDTLRSLAVYRKVYVQRPETKQIASIMQQGELAQGEKNYVLRVGALIFENVGQLATHQMAACHSKTAIYPIGFRATRMYWSSTNMRRRCRYKCTISEVDGKPHFSMSYKAALPGKNKPDKVITHADTVTTFKNPDANSLWLEILNPLEKLRSQHSVLKLFPAYINGEKLCGLTTPVVSRISESLPNIELCTEYKFRYGRTPLLELPLAINPTGCARSEPHIKQHRKKPHTLISNLISEYYESSGIGDASSLYGKQFVHSKSSQYRRMKSEWRSNVCLARSRIQGLGLFAARDIEPGTMVIEYIGDIIRTEVSEKREKMYEAANRGVYMFRLDSDHIVDATVTGGLARYINHSCKPNCVAEVVNFEKEKKIMIVSKRHILKGEELAYDYKFDFEDEGRKIPCLCGASNCKKWMN